MEDCPCFFFCSFWVVAMLFKAGSYFQLAFSLYGLTFFLYSRIILGIVLNGLFDVCFVFADHSVVIGADGLLGRGLCQFFSRTDEQRLLLLYWKRKKRGQSIKMNAKQNQAWFKAFLEKSLSCYVFLCVYLLITETIFFKWKRMKCGRSQFGQSITFLDS